MPGRRKLEFNVWFLFSAIMNIPGLQFLFSWLKFRTIATNNGGLRLRDSGGGVRVQHIGLFEIPYWALSQEMLTTYHHGGNVILAFTYEEHALETHMRRDYWQSSDKARISHSCVSCLCLSSAAGITGTIGSSGLVLCSIPIGTWGFVLVKQAFHQLNTSWALGVILCVVFPWTVFQYWWDRWNQSKWRKQSEVGQS